MDELKIRMQIGELENKFMDLENEHHRYEDRFRELRYQLEALQRESMEAFAGLSERFKLLEDKQNV